MENKMCELRKKKNKLVYHTRMRCFEVYCDKKVTHLNIIVTFLLNSLDLMVFDCITVTYSLKTANYDLQYFWIQAFPVCPLIIFSIFSGSVRQPHPPHTSLGATCNLFQNEILQNTESPRICSVCRQYIHVILSLGYVDSVRIAG